MGLCGSNKGDAADSPSPDLLEQLGIDGPAWAPESRFPVHFRRARGRNRAGASWLHSADFQRDGTMLVEDGWR